MVRLDTHHSTMSPCLAVVLSFLLVRVASYRLTMRPDHVRVSSTAPQSATFTCTADLALTGCQFRWWDSYVGAAGPLLDLSRGSQSVADSTHLSYGLTGYSYSGRGLGAGDCGVSLQVYGYKTYMVVCRVRAEGSGWSYAWVDFNADSGQPLPHTLTPREAVVLPGGEARFTLKAQEPLRRCFFRPPGLNLYFDKGAHSVNSTGRHRYLGAGVDDGECGLALGNVSEEDNGPVVGWMYNKAANNDTERCMALIVASLPLQMLTVSYESNRMTANCVVRDSRPAASISWTVDGEIVRRGAEDDGPADDNAPWVWPWDRQSTTQVLVLHMEPEHQGKNLSCVVLSQAFHADRAVAASTILHYTETSQTTPQGMG